MVTFWLIEAMSRVSLRCPLGKCEKMIFWLIRINSSPQASRAKAHVKDHPTLMELRRNAFTYFDNVLSFSNHLGIFSEEVNISGEQIGNIPQAFSHLACVSAAMNLGK